MNRLSQAARVSTGMITVSAVTATLIGMASTPCAEVAAAQTTERLSFGGNGTPQSGGQTGGYTLEFGSITGGGGVLPDGSLVVIGQQLVGSIRNQQYTIDIGAVPIMRHLQNCDRNGDASGDCVVGLPDIELLQACLQGPGATVNAACKAFDFDADGDVDFADFAAFQRAVNAR